MKQVRAAMRKQRKIQRHEKAVELQMALEDRAAARRLQDELAELARGSWRWAGRFKVQVRPEKPATRTSPVVKRLTIMPMKGPRIPTVAASPASSWVIDDRGMRGVIWQQSYLGRKSPNFYRGAARDNWEYDVRDEAVLLDADGEPMIVSNMGEDWIEIGAAWQTLEDASTRKNAKIQIRAIAPFDSDATKEEMFAALTHFCKTVLEPLGLPYSAVIHAPPEHGDQRNFHPHLAFSLRPMRRVEPYCWEVADDVCGELDGKDGVQMLRHLWAHSMSEAAERSGRTMHYTGLGYGARGLDFEPGVHVGEARSAMVRRGEQVWAYDRNRIKAERNHHRRVMRDLDKKIATLTTLRDVAIAWQAEAAARPRKVMKLEPATVPVRSALRSVAVAPAVARPPISASRRQRSTVHPLVSAGAHRRFWTAPLVVASPVQAQVHRRLVSAGQPGWRTHEPLVPAGAARITPRRSIAAAGVRLPTHPTVLVKSSSTTDQHIPSPIVAAGAPAPAKDQLKPARTVQTSAAARLVSAPVWARPKAKLLSAARDPEPTRSPLAPLVDLLRIARERREAERRDMFAATVTEAASAEPGRSAISPFEADGVTPAVALRDVVARGPGDIRTAPVPVRQFRVSVKRAKAHGTRSKAYDRYAADEPVTRTALPERVWFELNPLTVPPDQRSGPGVAPVSTHPAGMDPPSTAVGSTPDIGSEQTVADRSVRVASAAAVKWVREQVERLDAYVWDDAAGSFSIGAAAAKALNIPDDKLEDEQGQAALRAIRLEQQLMFARLVAEADQRPLSFRKTGVRPWPRDLDPHMLARLDRWSADEGFQHDLYFAVELQVDKAHRAQQARDRASGDLRSSAGAAQAPTRLPTPVPDGFGGWRDTPPPIFIPPSAEVVRLRAFDRKTGKPTQQLLMLAHFAGSKPRLVDRASDERLMTLPGAPAPMADLLAQWRHDDRVDDLITRTVTASRAAGKPAYPTEIADGLRAQRSITAHPPPPDLSRGPSRS